ncbi:MAG: sigma-70 family RNA polymerase sigma factor [Verrucomicrobiota bacterium]
MAPDDESTVTAPNPAANPLLTVKLPGLPSAAEIPGDPPAADAIEVLTRRMAAGDEEAFVRFHQLYFDRLYQFLLAVARGREQEARDALQETLVRVARSARGFDSEEVFWCWLKAVARNAARDGGRKERRYFDFLQNFARHPPAPPGDGDLDAALEECLDELTPGDRGLIEGKYLEGETVRELAAGGGMTEKAVESRLLRLRRRLRESLLQKLREP